MRICSDGIQLNSCIDNSNWIIGTDRPIKLEIYGSNLLPSIIRVKLNGLLYKESPTEVVYDPLSTAEKLIARFSFDRADYPGSGKTITYQVLIEQTTTNQIHEIDFGTLNLVRR